MKSKVVGIIGSEGKMAEWFIRHFKTCFKEVKGFDAGSTGNLKGLVESSDLIIVSTPIKQTVEVIRSLKPLVHQEQCVIDFCSLKEQPCLALHELSCHTMGTHPLFGPKTTHFKEHAIVLCETRPTDWEKDITRLFEQTGLKVLKMSPREHDRAMAVIQVLSHALYLNVGHTEHLKELIPFKTPSFMHLLQGLKGILCRSSDLYREIAFENAHATWALTEFQKRFDAYIKIIKTKDRVAFDRFFLELVHQSIEEEIL